MKLQDSPQFDPPLDNSGKKFSKHWMDWFLRLARALQDLFNSQIVANQTFSITAGPGPFTLTTNFSLRVDGRVLIFGNVVQAWVTAAPSWLVEILVDGAVVWTSGTITNTWQNVVAPVVEWDVTAGAHSASIRWTTGNANASITQGGVFVIPQLK